MTIRFNEDKEVPLNGLNEYHNSNGASLICNLPYDEEIFNDLLDYFENNTINKIEVFSNFNNCVYSSIKFNEIESMNKFLEFNNMYIQLRFIYRRLNE